MGPRLCSRSHVVYRQGGGDKAGQLLVELLSAEGTSPAKARVSFPGSQLAGVEFEGDDELTAITGALHGGTKVLKQFCDDGGALLEDVSGWGLLEAQPDLFERFRLTLELDFGLPERPFLGDIVGGPTPTDWGVVEFIVRHERADASIAVSIHGAGARVGTDPELAAVAARLVERYVREHPIEMREHYIRAANMRRAAGNPTWPDIAKGDPALVERFECRSQSVKFFFRAPYADGNVHLFPEGGALDDWANWHTADDNRRELLLASAIAYALANREPMRQAGLDPELLEVLHL